MIWYATYNGDFGPENCADFLLYLSHYCQISTEKCHEDPIDRHPVSNNILKNEHRLLWWGVYVDQHKTESLLPATLLTAVKQYSIKHLTLNNRYVASNSTNPANDPINIKLNENHKLMSFAIKDLFF